MGSTFEPRSSTSKGPHHDYSIIWLAGHDRDQALYRLHTFTHGFALAKLHHRYGNRVTKQFEKQSHEEVRPDDKYLDIAVRQIYTNFPVAYWLQKSQAVKLLAIWKWAAKPLQPTKGNLQGQDWTVGAEAPPPNKILPGFGQDVLITLQKEITSQVVQRSLVASNRTKRFLKEGSIANISSSATNPWHIGMVFLATIFQKWHYNTIRFHFSIFADPRLHQE